jgi:hypothetical protein
VHFQNFSGQKYLGVFVKNTAIRNKNTEMTEFENQSWYFCGYTMIAAKIGRLHA